MSKSIGVVWAAAAACLVSGCTTTVTIDRGVFVNGLPIRRLAWTPQSFAPAMLVC